MPRPSRDTQQINITLPRRVKAALLAVAEARATYPSRLVEEWVTSEFSEFFADTEGAKQ